MENTSNVKLIFKEGIMLILTSMTSMAIATKNIGINLLFRNNKARAMIRIKNIIKFLELLKSKSQEDNPIPKNKNRDNKTVIRNAPKIE